MTTELLDTENPHGSLTMVPKSPFAARVFGDLVDSKNKPVAAQYLQYYHEENPNADSQEGYEAVNKFIRNINGVPAKKKASKKHKV
jgi:hypothetical protein